MKERLRRVWEDPDRRRAAGLSLLMHALVVLLIGFGWDFDLPQNETETYLVIDLGTPALSEEASPAAADDETAQPSQVPAVQSDAPGRPAPGAPETDVETAGDPVAENQPPTAETPAPPAPPETTTADAEADDAQQAATPVPVPTPEARVPEAATPAPVPDVTIAVPEIAVPEVQATAVEEPLPVPAPSPEAVGGAMAVPTVTPEVQEEARSVTAPDAEVTAPAAQGVSAPRPTVEPAEASAVTAPEATLGRPEGRDVDAPVLSTVAGEAQAVGVEATVSVQALRRVPVPTVQAIIRADVEETGPGAAATVPDPDAPVGGDAARPGQVNGDPDADAEALGRAASPDGVEGGGGSPPQPAAPLVRTADVPLAVVLDNALGYPQEGLAQASWIAEMPVEGGATRLIAFFDEDEPARVGPIRSARDYMIDVARGSDAVLVHVGGSPSALAQLGQGVLPHLDAFAWGTLFARDGARSAPYNTYARGSALRDALTRLDVDAERTLRGFRPAAPGEGTTSVTDVSIGWSGAYEEAFRYFPEQDRYRWIRQGAEGVTAGGVSVQVDAVLVARVDATPIPNDAEGRLFIPIEGGAATLYWRGVAIDGSWSVADGLRFVGQDGTPILLEGLKVWAAFTPASVDVQTR